MKYCLIFNGSILYGFRHEHKKSGLSGYSKYLYDFQYKPYYGDPTEVMVFNTTLSAKVWLLQHSSFPKFIEYNILDTSEKTIDKLYLKGKYRIKTQSKIRTCEDNHIPLICEILVSEYNG